MQMGINQTRADDAAGKVRNFARARCIINVTNVGDFTVSDRNIGNTIGSARGIDHATILQ
jgi:hypothetical protein